MLSFTSIILVQLLLRVVRLLTGEICIALSAGLALQEGKENGPFVGRKWRLFAMMGAHLGRRNQKGVVQQQTHWFIRLGHADMMENRVLL